MEEPIEAAQANGGCQDARDANLRRTDCARSYCECRVCRNGVAGNRTIYISTDAAETGAKRVNQGWTKDVGFFAAAHLPARIHLMDGVQQRIRLSLRPSIIKIAGRKRVSFGKLLVDADGEIILVRDRGQSYVKGLSNSISVHRSASRGLRPEFHVRSYSRNGKGALCIGRHVDCL